MSIDSSENKLGDLIYAEIKKAFSICDQDGNGQLDRSEVRAVMKVFQKRNIYLFIYLFIYL